MSTRSKRAIVAPTATVAASASTTSATCQATVPGIDSAAAARSCSLRDTIITAAPLAASSVATARPIPREPPVTRATRPSSRTSTSASQEPGHEPVELVALLHLGPVAAPAEHVEANVGDPLQREQRAVERHRPIVAAPHQQRRCRYPLELAPQLPGCPVAPIAHGLECVVGALGGVGVGGEG